jgi:hypothetical protein
MLFMLHLPIRVLLFFGRAKRFVGAALPLSGLPELRLEKETATTYIAPSLVPQFLTLMKGRP